MYKSCINIIMFVCSMFLPDMLIWFYFLFQVFCFPNPNSLALPFVSEWKSLSARHLLKKNQCIIHMTASKEDDEHLVSPQSYDSWFTLLEAAKVRNHAPILDIAKQLEDKEVPKIFYHRKCRSLFTMKRDLETEKESSWKPYWWGWQ